MGSLIDTEDSGEKPGEKPESRKRFERISELTNASNFSAGTLVR